MTVKEFANKLKQFQSKVVTSPLSESEVVEIELALNRSLPEYYREFLMTIGIKQDVIHGLIGRFNDFDPLTDFLPEGQSQRYFRFGDNGGEDYWLLRNDDLSDHSIYEYEYYGDGEIKKIGKTFEGLLDASYLSLSANRETLISNSRKTWSVQFSIETDDLHEIIQSFRKEFNCDLCREVGNTQVSSAGVITSNGSITLEGAEITIKKQEYKDWETASYYFNWKESIEAMNTNSFIKRIENRLKNDGLKVTLIDYGIQVSQ
jgi:hypothetical protein